jgi:transcription initiation factor TFIID TATA-box-binding protein
MENQYNITHPSNAEQAARFTAPLGLSFAGDEKAVQSQAVTNADAPSAQAVATPAATPAAANGVSGIVSVAQSVSLSRRHR